MKYLGIDIGGTSVKMGIVTDQGQIVGSNSYDVAFDGYVTPILTTVLKKVDRFLVEENCKVEELGGIGISATGQIDTHSGEVIGVGGNIKNWLGAKIKEEFEKKYHIKAWVINDANSVALGEQWIGRAKNYINSIVITIGTGVGGGIILESNILLGQMGIAGELGHFSIHKEGRMCTCGNRGCYEQYASMTALRKMIIENKDSLGLSYLRESQINGKEIFALVEQGYKPVIEIVDQWIDHIAAGLISLTHIFNPEIILIGGGVSTQEELFIHKLRERVLSGVMKNFGKNLKLEAASLGNMAGLIGAVHYCMKQGEKDIC